MSRMLVLIDNSKTQRVVNVAPTSRRAMADEWQRQDSVNREVVESEVAT